jgi:hypothetical protein
VCDGQRNFVVHGLEFEQYVSHAGPNKSKLSRWLGFDDLATEFAAGFEPRERDEGSR